MTQEESLNESEVGSRLSFESKEGPLVKRETLERIKFFYQRTVLRTNPKIFEFLFLM